MKTTHSHITDSLPGKLIIFEWVDGSGKTTQALRLKRELKQKGVPVVVSHWKSAPHFHDFFELQKNQKRGSIEPLANLTLQAADLVYRLEKKIIPALRAGKTVILDRGLETIFARWYSMWLTHEQIEKGVLWVFQSYYKKLFDDATYVYFAIEEAISLERLRERLNPQTHTVSEGTLLDLHMVSQMTYNDIGEKMTLVKKRKLVNQIQRNMVRQYQEIHANKASMIRIDANLNRNQVHDQIIQAIA